jgi:oligopeptide transport system ATP-binding protein
MLAVRGGLVTNGPLIRVEGLVKHFPLSAGLLRLGRKILVRAVDGVGLEIRTGETLGLVGESGCGKSTLGRLILRLIEPNEGRIFFDGQEITRLSRRRMGPLRRDMQIVYQDPYGSLSPRKTVASIITEPLRIHRLAEGRRLQQHAAELMERVGLSPRLARLYPHEFSGGQRQRIGIARALALHPRFLVLDEPVSALDVSVRAQVLNLLQDLQEEMGLTYLLISHDLSVVKHVSDRVGVMYLGRIVELAGKHDLYACPRHPYTEALLVAIPVAAAGARRTRRILQGDVPTPIAPPPGCHFHPRCPYAGRRCQTDVPSLKETNAGHWVACHLAQEGLALQGLRVGEDQRKLA